MPINKHLSGHFCGSERSLPERVHTLFSANTGALCFGVLDLDSGFQFGAFGPLSGLLSAECLSKAFESSFTRTHRWAHGYKQTVFRCLHPKSSTLYSSAACVRRKSPFGWVASGRLVWSSQVCEINLTPNSDDLFKLFIFSTFFISLQQCCNSTLASPLS